MLKRLLYILPIVSTLWACALTPEKDKDLFDVWQIPFEPVEVVQLLSGQYGEKDFVFQIALSMNEERLSLIGIDGLGRRAFSIKWHGNKVVTQKESWLPDGLKAEYILHDLMLAYWPIDALNHSSEVIIESPFKRVVTKGTDTVATVTRMDDHGRWNGRTVIENHARGYRIEVQSREVKGG